MKKEKPTWIFFRAKTSEGTYIYLSMYDTSCCINKYPASWKVEPKAFKKLRDLIAKGELPAKTKLIEGSIIWAISEAELITNPTNLGCKRKNPTTVEDSARRAYGKKLPYYASTDSDD